MALARTSIGLCILLVLIEGCARGQGTLFARIDPPPVWPPPPDRPRIKFVGSLSGSHDLHAARSGVEGLRAALRGPRPPINFVGPNAVATLPSGLVAVADGAGACVHVIDLDERTHMRISGWEDGRFALPIGVTWARERLFVTDAQRHEVIELDPARGVVGRFGAGELLRPVGIAYVPRRDNLYVVDGGAHCIKVFDLSGAMVNVIGRQGTDKGAFNFPSHIACVGDRIAVADTGNARVQSLDLDGACLNVVGRRGNAAGDLALPKGVAFDSEGHLYVVDARFENVQVFDPAGRLLMVFGEEGDALGRFSLPAGISIDGRDWIWVADSGNHRVQVFAYLGMES